MDFVEKWGDDVESAVRLALADMKLSRDEVNVTVLEEPSRGFFGIGSKLALVRVEKIKKEEVIPVKEEEPAKVEVADIEARLEQIEKSGKPARSEESKSSEGKGNRRRDRDRRRGKKPVKKKLTDEAFEMLDEDLPELNLRQEFVDLPVVEDHTALSFLKDVAVQMGLDLDIVCHAGSGNVFVEIKGKDSGTIIGKRGQTLDAIQYLTSLVVNKDNKDYVKVIVDAEGYRARREKTLEQLAERLARKVVRSGRSVKLEPMNPYERKVIHATLQHNPNVTTKSEGTDPYRRVVIELK